MKLVFIKILSVISLLFITISYGQDKKKFSVIINTIPSGAEVYVNEKNIAKTPCGFRAPENYYLEIKIRKKGYGTWSKAYRVQKDINIDITLNTLSKTTQLLEKYPLILKTIPTNADVIINDKLRGHTPFDVTVPAGYRLNITLSKEGYKKWQQTMTLNDEIRKTIKLERKSKANYLIWLIPGVALVSYGLIKVFTPGGSTPANSNNTWPQPPGRP